MAWENVPNAKQLPLSPALKQKLAGKTNVDFTKGAWLVIKLDEQHILGEYHTWANPGGNIPTAAASSFVQSSVVKTMRVMEEYAHTKPLRCLNKMP